ncbi:MULTISPECIES: ABC transporter ATP-binding protein [Thermodesulfovibrio]|jgi:branched-chain amino acid transport system ATP-binding protein|uniref:High-affinity branched-chain amino acid transport, ATP-binding protein n=1 Tax=Thermodesulfovibrio yellowstonii (strain ATCC 51303 / DSM 11347 / YP87) TaxID=289376 RepID=B5YK41_THEYD|nr:MULTISPECIES: ABC transporter ATP-binding protein [Thermodesulfovibrio]ACI20716.1 high-affinity branched-chain amino acid transport, ATP-binding protein [Thermodesulfovibrio yellowstonii DSM 11347]MDI6865353.1 ABC transporter ATP-binding protein [Thermodesulfovibrio yellowstonii]
MELLNIKNLNTGYGDLQILRNISLRINKGEIVALLGSNGAGKSTLMRSIVGRLRVWSGEIVFKGQNITNLPPEKIVKLGISLAPERRRIFSGMTVKENLEIGAYQRRNGFKERIEKVFSIFPRLYERRNHLGGDLSGGEQQMLAIGRALMNEPDLLLIDECSLGLAPTIVENIIEVIKEINKSGVSLLIVEQDVQMALEISNRAYVMEVGEITISGESKKLINDARIKESYLGM